MSTPLPARVSSRLVLLLAGLALLAPLLATAAPAGAEPSVRRLAGPDRYATAVAVSRASRPNGAPVAVLTTGASFPDALAGGPAASVLGGPVLLVQRDRVPAVVLDELRRLRPQLVLVLGGPAAVSGAVTRQLAAEAFTVERIAGASRYETAALVSRRAFPVRPEVAYVATGADYPDALAGSAAAGAAGGPVLLVGRDSLPAATARELHRLLPQRIVVLGGTSAVSAGVERSLRLHALSVSRIAGGDRYATAVAVARATGGAPSSVYVATGRGFADALSGGPAAAAARAPVLLTQTHCVPKVVRAELTRLGNPPMTVLGGTAVLGGGVTQLQPCEKLPNGTLSAGVSLVSLNDPNGPWRGKIVTVSPSAVSRIDTVLSNDALPGLETTSSMARRTGALVAVNGDFALGGGRPVHAFAKDGRLVQTPQTVGRNVVVESRSSRARLGFPAIDVRFSATEGSSAPISKVNGGASGPGAIAFTTREAGSASPVPAGCAARLRSAAAPAVDATGRTVQRYTVTATQCSGSAYPPGEDVVTAPADGAYAGLLATLVPGQPVSVSWTLGWRDVLDGIGGNPTLVEGGRIVSGNVDGTDGFSRRNPRTAVGYTSDGTVLMVTVDGRGAGGSVGMSLRELAELFVRLGATHALNLDGGGSTTMVVNGAIQNVPSDGPERPVSSALVVRGATSSGSSSLRTSADLGPVAPLSFEEQSVADAQVLGDPGSTGGLLGAFRP